MPQMFLLLKHFGLYPTGVELEILENLDFWGNFFEILFCFEMYKMHKN